MQITDKDIQKFRERAKTELQSNGAVGRLAWDTVVNALCNEVEELRKDSAPGNVDAMRRALKSAHRTLKLVCEHAGEFVQPRLAEEIIRSGVAVERALSAPARNCDICRTKRDAKMEYDSRHDAEYGSKDDFVDWLFRPAEGGAE